jgi:hypothetical protein
MVGSTINATEPSYGAPRQSFTRQEYHKSLKSNAALAKSPTRTLRTQQNHVFMAVYAVFKLECLKMTHKLNHFALRAKLHVKALQQAFSELTRLKLRNISL